MKSTIVVAMSLLLLDPSHACSPVRAMDIAFDKNSSELSGEQILRLANFVLAMKSEYPNHEFFQLSGTAENAERDAGRVAERRVAQVRDFFRRIDYRQAPVLAEAHVYPTTMDWRGENGRRVEVLFLPGSPHGCDIPGLFTPATPERAEGNERPGLQGRPGH